MDSKFGFEISVPRCLATVNSVGAFISAGEWRLLEPPKQLYRFAEADDRSVIPPRTYTVGWLLLWDSLADPKRQDRRSIACVRWPRRR
jgi:hypothetical protein